jgi:signal transduction histidine kinase
LGNPLSTIGMCASALAAGCSPIEMRMAADLIERSVAWMHRMIRDLSDVASIEAGRLALESRAEDPAVLIAAAVEMFAASARDAGVEPTMRAASNLPLVQADAGRVLQVLGNLLTNALRHTASGGRVAVSADVDRDLVRFTVDDTGTGITAEDLPHVFDRFWHKRDSAQRGSGLGLPIVRGIVEAHGGLVDVRSTPGEGSHFSFTIPVAR